MPNPEVPRAPKKPSMKRRAKWHNYALPGLYMLTLETLGRLPCFGRLVATPQPHVVPSALGQQVLSTEVYKIHRVYPNVDVWEVCLMPDHLHIIVHVREAFPKGKHLGRVVSGFKYGCAVAYIKDPGHTGAKLFERGYHDRILLNEMDVECWRKYLQDNPRRAVIKRDNPNYFTVCHNLEVEGAQYQAVGNRFLLNIPDKMEVIVHRADDDATHSANVARWMECCDRGGVLVSAAIAQREKEVLRMAMNRGGRIILLRDNGFPKYYKPAGEAFDACAEGLLLQLSPWEFRTEKETITRAKCLYLNDLATAIAHKK